MTDQTRVWWLSRHEFYVYPASSDRWNEVGGLYIFARLDPGGWVPLYVGQTENFRNRLSHHDRWQEATRRGATHIHARTEVDREERVRIERDLIQAYQPLMNVLGT